MSIELIAAVAQNRVIGKDGRLPWYLHGDLKQFRRLTTGHTVVMGRLTYQSILARLGKPLPERHNIVLSRDPQFLASGCTTLTSFDDVSIYAQTKRVFVIGGANVYTQALPRVTTMHLTIIDQDYEGDTLFPEYSMDDWLVKTEESTPSRLPPYRFLTLIRKQSD